jgi:hypothetical protein
MRPHEALLFIYKDIIHIEALIHLLRQLNLLRNLLACFFSWFYSMLLLIVTMLKYGFVFDISIFMIKSSRKVINYPSNEALGGG